MNKHSALKNGTDGKGFFFRSHSKRREEDSFDRTASMTASISTRSSHATGAHVQKLGTPSSLSEVDSQRSVPSSRNRDAPPLANKSRLPPSRYDVCHKPSVASDRTVDVEPITIIAPDRSIEKQMVKIEPKRTRRGEHGMTNGDDVSLRSMISARSKKSMASRSSLLSLASSQQNATQAPIHGTSLKRKLFKLTPQTVQDNWISTVKVAIREARAVQILREDELLRKKNEKKLKQEALVVKKDLQLEKKVHDTEEWYDSDDSSSEEDKEKPYSLVCGNLFSSPRDANDPYTHYQDGHDGPAPTTTQLQKYQPEQNVDDDQSATSLEFLFNWMTCSDAVVIENPRLQKSPRGMVVINPSARRDGYPYKHSPDRSRRSQLDRSGPRRRSSRMSK